MLSKHFNRIEFKCHCGRCDRDVVDVELLRLLETVREHFNEPVIITSGNRCEAHNKAVGGAKDSQHLLGKAADIVVRNIPAKDVYDFLCNHQPLKNGYGLYPSWVHLDVREAKARWIKKNPNQNG